MTGPVAKDHRIVHTEGGGGPFLTIVCACGAVITGGAGSSVSVASLLGEHIRAARRPLANGGTAGAAGEALRALAAHVVTACREGAVEALRQAADEIELPSLDEGDWQRKSSARNNAEAAAEVWLRQRADAIEAHVAKTGESDG